MDEFFAAVEKLDNPQLRGKPIIVGGSPTGRGVVSTASYEARKFGCHSAMPTAQALRLCPQAILLPGNNPRYGEVSREIFRVFEQFTPLVEPLSVDEAFLDITGTERLFGPPVQVAKLIKQAIKSQVGIIASVGVASNKFLAKLASDLDKPDGLTIIPDDKIQQILDPLPIRKLWGVGPATAKRLLSRGIDTIGKLRRFPRELLLPLLGNQTDRFLSLARGEDYREIQTNAKAKSIGQENTFPTNIETLEELRKILHTQSDKVARRTRQSKLLANTITIKLRDGNFNTYSRSITLHEATNSTQKIYQTARRLLDDWAAIQFAPLRLIGVTASNLKKSAGMQLGLFEQTTRDKQQKLDQALDAITKKFGDEAISHADEH